MEPGLTKYIEDLTKEYEKHDSKFDIGYPMNLKGHDILGKAKRMLVHHIPFLLHLGNPLIVEPFWESQCMQEEKSLVKELIAPWGGTQDNTWGYIATGGTESNVAAIKIALMRFKPQKPILLFSTETHYSIEKILDLCMHSFIACVKCPTTANGQIDHTRIQNILSPFYCPETPVVVIATLGTTMKGASDDIPSILKVLLEMGVRREKLFVHVDAALSGGFWHLDKGHYPYQLGREIDSIAISGLKWYGSDVCSLFALYQGDGGTNLGEYFQCVKTRDPGISGCRNGFPVISWKIRLLQFDWQKEYDKCKEIVIVAVKRFTELGVETLVNQVSLIVCFPAPPQEITKKYCLPTYNDQHLGSISHIVVLPHVTECVIDSFFIDLSLLFEPMELKFNSKI